LAGVCIWLLIFEPRTKIMMIFRLMVNQRLS
jgi:hypothetical protein